MQFKACIERKMNHILFPQIIEYWKISFAPGNSVVCFSEATFGGCWVDIARMSSVPIGDPVSVQTQVVLFGLVV